MDRACKLEAILKSLSTRKKELRIEQSQIDNHFIRMMNSLQVSLQSDEDLTVILADAFSAIVAAEEVAKSEVVEEEPSRERAPSSPPEANNDGLNKPSALQRETTPPMLNVRFGCFSGDVFDSSDDWRRTGARMSLPDIPPSALYDAIIPNHSSPNGILPAASHPSPSAMRAGAQAWRDRHSRQSHHGINFRTGMSGHTALLSTHARHPHDYLDPSSWWGGRMRMSSHTGLSTSSSTRATKTAPGFLDALTPSILRPRQEESRDVPQAGSM